LGAISRVLRAQHDAAPGTHGLPPREHAPDLPTLVWLGFRRRRRAVRGERRNKASRRLLWTYPRPRDRHTHRASEQRLYRGATSHFLPGIATSLPELQRARLHLLRGIRCSLAPERLGSGARPTSSTRGGPLGALRRESPSEGGHQPHCPARSLGGCRLFAWPTSRSLSPDRVPARRHGMPGSLPIAAPARTP